MTLLELVCRFVAGADCPPPLAALLEPVLAAELDAAGMGDLAARLRLRGARTVPGGRLP